MSVIINTNSAATVASNNLAGSNALLQKSLNRLSSGSKIVNPSDDAGGLAVSMKLSAAAVRQGAVSNNISNAVSMLQTQDGVLAVSSKILNRMSELKVLHSDITKSTSDRANYQAEFAALQSQLTANGAEKFNGVSLFATNSLSVAATEDGNTSVSMQGINLLGTSGPVAWSNIVNDIAPGSNWTSSNPAISFSGGYTRFHGDGTLTTTQSNISGAYTMSFTLNTAGGVPGTATVTGGGGGVLDLAALTSDGSDHPVTISVDAAGTASWDFGNGAQTGTIANFGSVGGAAITFASTGTGSIDMHLASFSLTSTGGGGPSNNVGTVAAASSLGTLGLSSITGAISDLATYRAANGANQSRLGFATELLTVNKANLEAANSRITDVDVATESTQLARFNVLVQAGTSMLAQANQSSQMALKLLQ